MSLFGGLDKRIGRPIRFANGAYPSQPLTERAFSVMREVWIVGVWTDGVLWLAVCHVHDAGGKPVVNEPVASVGGNEWLLQVFPARQFGQFLE